jgi:hypothetical protein
VSKRNAGRCDWEVSYLSRIGEGKPLRMDAARGRAVPQTCRACVEHAGAVGTWLRIQLFRDVERLHRGLWAFKSGGALAAGARQDEVVASN